jgi:hypothetical protein
MMRTTLVAGLLSLMGLGAMAAPAAMKPAPKGAAVSIERKAERPALADRHEEAELPEKSETVELPDKEEGGCEGHTHTKGKGHAKGKGVGHQKKGERGRSEHAPGHQRRASH